MSKGRILKMALDEIVGGVKKVDLGDLTKKVKVGDRVEAVKRMLGDAGEKVASAGSGSTSEAAPLRLSISPTSRKRQLPVME